MRFTAKALLAFVLAAAVVPPAEAGLFRAYLSVTGNDANACTLQAPCRLLPAALAAVNDGGEVWILDSANFNGSPVTIGKSVTILAIPGALASIVTGGGAALTIDAIGAKVGLRNLTIVNLNGGTSGVIFNNGAQLNIEECEIQGMPDRGILVPAGNVKVAIRNTVVRDSGVAGIDFVFAANANLENVTVRGNSYGIRASEVSNMTVTDSLVIDNSVAGITSQTNSGLATQVIVERSTLHNNGTAIVASAGSGGGSIANVVARGNSITGNDIGVSVTAVAGSGISASATLQGNVISHNRIGVSSSGTGTTLSRTMSDNTLVFNTQLDVSGSLTPMGTQ
jgi:hypothetical protein